MCRDALLAARTSCNMMSCAQEATMYPVTTKI